MAYLPGKALPACELFDLLKIFLLFVSCLVLFEVAFLTALSVKLYVKQVTQPFSKKFVMPVLVTCIVLFIELKD